jgi:hypothetical protein
MPRKHLPHSKSCSKQQCDSLKLSGVDPVYEAWSTATIMRDQSSTWCASLATLRIGNIVCLRATGR